MTETMALTLLCLAVLVILLLLVALYRAVHHLIMLDRRVQGWESAWSLATDMCALGSCRQPPEAPEHRVTEASGHRFVAARLMMEPVKLLYYDLLTASPERDERGRWWPGRSD